MSKRGVLVLCAALVIAVACVGYAGDRPLIGVIVPTLAHPFCRAEIDLAERVCEVLGADIEVWNYEWNVDKEIEGIENLITMGADAIVVHASNAEIGGTEIALASQAGVAIVIADQYPSTVELGEDPFFVGCLKLGDTVAGYNMTKTLIDEGYSKFAWVGPELGAPYGQLRYAGFKQAVEESAGAEIVVEQWGIITQLDAVEATENVLTAHGDAIDCIVYPNGMYGMGGVEAAEKMGASVGIGTFDLSGAILDYIGEAKIAAGVGGHWVQLGLGVVLAYDAVMGNTHPLVYYNIAPVLLTSPADLAAYNAYFIDQLPFSDEEILAMSLTYNPPMAEALAGYTVQAVTERREAE